MSNTNTTNAKVSRANVGRRVTKMHESKLIEEIKRDYRVDSISDERDYRGSDLNDPQVKEYIKRTGDNGDGFWIYLKPGWVDNAGTGAHQVHESSVQEAYTFLQGVSKCKCSECK
jgi:hypothetical protein